MKPVNVADYRLLARRRLPRFLFDYLDGAAMAERTKAANEKDLDATSVKQRVLRGVSSIDTSTCLMGEKYSMPVALAPVGIAGMYARRGECQAAKAAEASGVPFTLSTVGICSLREVDGTATKPFWFQVYMIRDRGFMRDLLALAKDCQVSTLILTVDMPVPGIRYRDYRSGLAGESRLGANSRRLWQAALRPRWSFDVGLNGRPHQLGNVAPVLGKSSGLEDFMAWMLNNFDPSVTWRDLEFVREHWNGRIVIKGISTAEDACDSAAAGADGIVVSNHGGRQLDGVQSTASVLPGIVDAVSGRLEVLADGGVRSGLDVLRMVALGAKGVLIGRSWVYGLAAGGQAGVERVLELIRAELNVGMALTGCGAVAEIGRDVLTEPPRGTVR